jgi:hypothetical protein
MNYNPNIRNNCYLPHPPKYPPIRCPPRPYPPRPYPPIPYPEEDIYW